MWKTIPDNLLGLTKKGKQQAANAGKRVEHILRQDRCQRVHLVISPFERTLQTAASLRPAFEHRIVRTDIESRIREQEVGNLQDDEFQEYRQEQKKVGRFWYRFPTGESGADVFDRVKSWWFESVLTVNLRVGFEPIDAMVIVTHGLTMRFILMQLFNWSPTTFHSVWYVRFGCAFSCLFGSRFSCFKSNLLLLFLFLPGTLVIAICMS
jgi:broad specificity phosphatase PhoE